MAIQYPQNTTFQEAISKASEVVSKIPRPTIAQIKAYQQRQSATIPSASPVAQPTGNISTSASDNSIMQKFKNLGRISTQYGGSTNYEKFHPGIDIANVEGTPIPVYASGKVVEAVTGKTQTPNTPSFGNYVIIEDVNGNKWRYSHLKQEYVKVGQQVQAGMTLGEMGRTGSTYAPSGGDASHLDLRIMDAAGQYLNPTSYLSSIE